VPRNWGSDGTFNEPRTPKPATALGLGCRTPVRLSAKDKEILDFLAVVDGAGGMSTAAASRVLKCVRARGNEAQNLPKSMTTCWK
jgi:hypothetical protein